jgi:hypothetical protein
LHAGLVILAVRDVRRGETAKEEIFKLVSKGKEEEVRGRVEGGGVEVRFGRLSMFDGFCGENGRVGKAKCERWYLRCLPQTRTLLWEEVLQINVLSMALLNIFMLSKPKV